MLAFRNVLRLLGHLGVALLAIGVCVAGFRRGVLPLLEAVLSGLTMTLAVGALAWSRPTRRPQVSQRVVA